MNFRTLLSLSTTPRRLKSSTLVCMNVKKPDNLSAIRNKFGVPARRGGAVEINGHPGVITGMSGDFVRVKLTGMAAGLPFHPHEIVYSQV
ncbi:hypothetical protein [Variovorax sp. RCC_210]|uniref:hypothetical protein n=1 Tax=Variovorax sp. RCC_210 TaxID=3239217 RepID=UPI00352518CF